MSNSSTNNNTNPNSVPLSGGLDADKRLTLLENSVMGLSEQFSSFRQDFMTFVRDMRDEKKEDISNISKEIKEASNKGRLTPGVWVGIVSVFLTVVGLTSTVLVQYVDNKVRPRDIMIAHVQRNLDALKETVDNHLTLDGHQKVMVLVSTLASDVKTIHDDLNSRKGALFNMNDWVLHGKPLEEEVSVLRIELAKLQAKLQGKLQEGTRFSKEDYKLLVLPLNDRVNRLEQQVARIEVQ